MSAKAVLWGNSTETSHLDYREDFFHALEQVQARFANWDQMLPVVLLANIITQFSQHERQLPPPLAIAPEDDGGGDGGEGPQMHDGADAEGEGGAPEQGGTGDGAGGAGTGDTSRRPRTSSRGRTPRKTSAASSRAAAAGGGLEMLDSQDSIIVHSTEEYMEERVVHHAAKIRMVDDMDDLAAGLRSLRSSSPALQPSTPLTSPQPRHLQISKLDRTPSEAKRPRVSSEGRFSSVVSFTRRATPSKIPIPKVLIRAPAADSAGRKRLFQSSSVVEDPADLADRI